MVDQQQKKEEEWDAPEHQSLDKSCLRKNTHWRGHKQKKEEKGHEDILCLFSLCPDDALLACGFTNQKKRKKNLYCFEKRFAGFQSLSMSKINNGSIKRQTSKSTQN
jgi:hypothetical protein